MTNHKNDIFNAIRDQPLFENLTDTDITNLTKLVTYVEYKQGKYIIKEKALSDKVYIVLSGKATVCKEKQGDIHTIAALKKHNLIGELGLIGFEKRTASVIAKSDTQMISIEISALKDFINNRPRQVIYENLSRLLAHKLKKTSTKVMNTLHQKTEYFKLQSLVGTALIYLVSMLCLYIILTSATLTYINLLPSAHLVNIVVLLVYLFAAYMLSRTLAMPKQFYGITLNNWRKNILETMAYTIPLILIAILIKFMAMHGFLGNRPSHFIDITSSFNQNKIGFIKDPTTYFLLTITLFIFFVSVQELITRGIIQSLLSKLLTNKHSTLLAILISNLMFSSVHAHIDFKNLLLSFISGLFWGWLYAKQKSLLGPIISHIMLGVVVLYLLGLQNLL